MEIQAPDILYLTNTFAYYGNKPVLKNLSVEIKAGQLTCLCGPNGSGKSTLLSVLAGAREPQLKVVGGVNNKGLREEKALNALELKKLSRKKASRLVSFMQQGETSTWDFSVKELVLQGRFCHTKSGSYTKADEELALRALQELNIEELAERKVHSLSGGEFQKVRIARALCQGARFILLDEPAANLDFVYEPWLLRKLKELAQAQEIGILVSIHDVNQAAAYADRLILLPLLQQVICGTIQEVLTLDNLKKTYGMEFECQKVNYFQSLL